MAERLTIYVGPPVADALAGIGPGIAGRSGDPGSRSGRLNTICERYLAVIRRDLPDFTEAQWNALTDCLKSTFLGEIEIEGMALDVADADRLEGLGQKWNVDAISLAKRIQTMTFGQRVAIAEEVERRWREVAIR